MVLDDLGVLDAAMYIERATMENQKIFSLSEVSEDSAPYFSMIMVRLRGESLDL